GFSLFSAFLQFRFSRWRDTEHTTDRWWARAGRPATGLVVFIPLPRHDLSRLFGTAHFSHNCRGLALNRPSAAA
ncbi:MAG: hypothetical protein M3464_11200, partial [Chloroflexota bacterium]|nr:hypothetical protein [Chloroflexota bacterium]